MLLAQASGVANSGFRAPPRPHSFTAPVSELT